MVIDENQRLRKISRFFPSNYGWSETPTTIEKATNDLTKEKSCQNTTEDDTVHGVGTGPSHQETKGDNGIDSTFLRQRPATTDRLIGKGSLDLVVDPLKSSGKAYLTTSPDNHQQGYAKETRRQGIYGAQSLATCDTENILSDSKGDSAASKAGFGIQSDPLRPKAHYLRAPRPAPLSLGALVHSQHILSAEIRYRTISSRSLSSATLSDIGSARQIDNDLFPGGQNHVFATGTIRTYQSQSASDGPATFQETHFPSAGFATSTSFRRDTVANVAAVRSQSDLRRHQMHNETRSQPSMHVPEFSTPLDLRNETVFPERRTERLLSNDGSFRGANVESPKNMALDHNKRCFVQSSSSQIPYHCKPSFLKSSTLPCTELRSVMSSHASRMSGDDSAQDLPVKISALDLDRDASGALLPLHLRRFTSQSSAKQSDVRNSAQEDHRTPANLYTSPKRIEHAIAVSSSNLKRKRMDTILPPPAYIYQRSGDPNFNIFTNGFLLYPELCLALAAQMQLIDLVSLYAISKDFHTIIDSRFTTTCLTQAIRKAPQSAGVFIFRAYAQYCRQDPAARIPHPNPAKAALSIPRTIPSFRWVAFVLHREKVVHELITVFAERGCPLPARCNLALKRIWMLMDVPDNARRIAIIHNHRMITDLDLYFLMCFFVKLDMVTNDPVAEQHHSGLRKLLLTQRGGLDTILKVIKRDIWRKQSDLVDAWIRTSMNISGVTDAELDEMNIHSILGVPRDEVGQGKYEYWGMKGINDKHLGRKRLQLLRPDQLVLRESVRRGLKFSKHFMRCVLYGYVRPDTLQDYAPRKYGRRIAEWKDEDYSINDTIGNIRALAVEDGGDALLDLGDTGRGSTYTIQNEAVGEQERAMRDNQAKLLRGLYEVSEREQAGEMAF